MFWHVLCSSQAEGVELWGGGLWQLQTGRSPRYNQQRWASSWVDCNECDEAPPVGSDKRSFSPAAKADHSNNDCFLLVFLSHGENDHVYTYNDKIPIQDITCLFKGDKCKSLVGKPKIFVWQVGRALFQPVRRCVGAFVMSLCVPSPGMPWRQTRWASDTCCFRRRRQRVKKKRGGGGCQRHSHPSRRGRFHHVLLGGWRWERLIAVSRGLWWVAELSNVDREVTSEAMKMEESETSEDEFLLILFYQ